jgi:hypothetical protein
VTVADAASVPATAGTTEGQFRRTRRRRLRFVLAPSFARRWRRSRNIAPLVPACPMLAASATGIPVADAASVPATAGTTVGQFRRTRRRTLTFVLAYSFARRWRIAGTAQGSFRR